MEGEAYRKAAKPDGCDRSGAGSSYIHTYARGLRSLPEVMHFR